MLICVSQQLLSHSDDERARPFLAPLMIILNFLKSSYQATPPKEEFKSNYLCVHLFIQQIFLKHLLHTVSSARD